MYNFEAATKWFIETAAFLARDMDFDADDLPTEKRVENWRESTMRIIDQHKAAHKEIDRLREEVEQLRKQQGDLIESTAALNASKTDEIGRLWARIAKLDTQLGRKPCQEDRCVRYAQLRADKARMWAENDQLRKDLENAKARASQWADIAGEHGEEVDRLRAENERLREWKPIETAPQDGTLLLVGWWRSWPEKQWCCEVSAAGNLDTGRQGMRWAHGQATHWMPLPEPAKDS